MHNSKNILTYISILIIGVLIGFSVTSFINKPVKTALEQSQENYPLLARRIFLENPNESIVNFSNLRNILTKYFEDEGLKGSLYFEYLPTGTSIRISGEEQEVAASLIKLPAAMELYKAVEQGSVNLDEKVTLKEEWLDARFGNLYKKGTGYTLTVKEAVEIMLRDSDNTALQVVGSKLVNKVKLEENPFNFLDASYTQNPDLSVSISARSYSSFLKCLYFSCYLNKEHSQELLAYLSDTPFRDRMRAGIDEGVVVAHKIGTFGNTTQSDCGIVYLEKRHYVLCAMIEGADNAETNAYIAKISELTFDYVSDIKDVQPATPTN